MEPASGKIGEEPRRQKEQLVQRPEVQMSLERLREGSGGHEEQAQRSGGGWSQGERHTRRPHHAMACRFCSGVHNFFSSCFGKQGNDVI